MDDLPVLTWYFSVVAQSSMSCCSGKARSGTSRSRRRFMSSGWWKSRTFSFRSLVAFTKSKSTSITFSRNSRVSGPAVTVVGMRSGWDKQKNKRVRKKPNENFLSVNMKSVPRCWQEKWFFLSYRDIWPLLLQWFVGRQCRKKRWLVFFLR